MQSVEFIKTMKRFRVAGGDREEVEAIDGMARTLLLLSHSGGEDVSRATSSSGSPPPLRVFECKTCNRQFPSFQALGGHRASHKKPKLAGVDGGRGPGGEGGDGRPRVHECAICGLEFAVGQALGGHMRRHRAAAGEGVAAAAHAGRKGEERRSVAPWLDLNVLPPSEGGDVVSCRKRIFGFELVETNPVAVDCFH